MFEVADKNIKNYFSLILGDRFKTSKRLFKLIFKWNKLAEALSIFLPADKWVYNTDDACWIDLFIQSKADGSGSMKRRKLNGLDVVEGAWSSILELYYLLRWLGYITLISKERTLHILPTNHHWRNVKKFTPRRICVWQATKECAICVARHSISREMCNDQFLNPDLFRVWLRNVNWGLIRWRNIWNTVRCRLVLKTNSEGAD